MHLVYQALIETIIGRHISQPDPQNVVEITGYTLRGDDLWHLADGFLEGLEPCRAVVVGSDQNKALEAEANGGRVNDGHAFLHNTVRVEAFDPPPAGITGQVHVFGQGVYTQQSILLQESQKLSVDIGENF